MAIFPRILPEIKIFPKFYLNSKMEILQLPFPFIWRDAVDQNMLLYIIIERRRLEKQAEIEAESRMELAKRNIDLRKVFDCPLSTTIRGNRRRHPVSRMSKVLSHYAAVPVLPLPRLSRNSCLLGP